jgi:hypothetical protein
VWAGCDFLRFVEVENDLFLPLPFEEIPFRPVAIGAGCNVNAIRFLQFVEAATCLLACHQLPVSIHLGKASALQ